MNYYLVEYTRYLTLNNETEFILVKASNETEAETKARKNLVKYGEQVDIDVKQLIE